MTVDIFLQFFLAEKNEAVLSGVQFHLRRLFQQFRVKLDRSDAAGVLPMPVRLGPSVCGQLHIGVFQNVVLEVLNRPLSTDKKKRILVVQHTHFIRHKQFAAR